MLRLTVLLLVAVQSILAYDVLQTLNRMEREEDPETRLLPGSSNKFTVLSDVPNYITVLVDKSNGIIYGSGIIVNRYWVVTTRDSIDSVAATDLKVYARVLNANDFTATDVLMRRGKQIIKDTAYVATKPILNPLILLKVCPSFPAGLAATFSTTSFPMATDVRMMRYVAGDNLYYEDKKVGEFCECDGVTDFQTDPATSTHVCLQEHLTVKGETADFGFVIVTKKSDGAVIGFLVKQQTATTGDIVINVPKFTGWINTNAVPSSPQIL